MDVLILLLRKMLDKITREEDMYVEIWFIFLDKYFIRETENNNRKCQTFDLSVKEINKQIN